jgi:hypothetical protein
MPCSGSRRRRGEHGGGRLGDVVKFNWEMVRTRDSETVATGLEFLILDGERRIKLDYQFIEG